LAGLRRNEAETTQVLSRNQGLSDFGGAGEVCAKPTDAAEAARPVRSSATSNILIIDMLSRSPGFKRNPDNTDAQMFQC
jgi:hypothetical protein